MKIIKIEEQEWIYTVTFKPNFIERLFGVKEKSKKYKQTGSQYDFGGGNVYVDEKGRKLGNGNWIGESIDNWKHKF